MDIPADGDQDLKGAWTMDEWSNDIYVMITNLKDGATWNSSNSAMYSKETYYYNN